MRSKVQQTLFAKPPLRCRWWHFVIASHEQPTTPSTTRFCSLLIFFTPNISLIFLFSSRMRYTPVPFVLSEQRASKKWRATLRCGKWLVVWRERETARVTFIGHIRQHPNNGTKMKHKIIKIMARIFARQRLMRNCLSNLVGVDHKRVETRFDYIHCFRAKFHSENVNDIIRMSFDKCGQQKKKRTRFPSVDRFNYMVQKEKREKQFKSFWNTTNKTEKKWNEKSNETQQWIGNHMQTMEKTITRNVCHVDGTQRVLPCLAPRLNE